MNRSQYIRWAKDRAMECVKVGDLQGALESLFSDLDKHPETRNNIAVILGISLVESGLLKSQEKVLRFIEGVN